MEPFDLGKWNGFSAAGGDPSLPAMVNGVSIDSRSIHTSQSLFAALPGSNHDGHAFVKNCGAKFALVKKDWEPEFTSDHPILLRVENPLHSLQEVARSYRKSLSCKVVAIAGSYGKTMVKDLLQAFLSTKYITAASPESFNSQIGVPLSLFRIGKDDEIALIETGFSHAGELKKLVEIILPDYCIITHLGKKHLTTMDSRENIACELAELFNKISPKGWAFLPNDPLLLLHLKTLAKVHFWDEPEDALPMTLPAKQDPQYYSIAFPGGEKLKGKAGLGYSYYSNLLNMAIKPAWLFGIGKKEIEKTLLNYTSEPRRTEIWQSPFGATFVNTPYSADPISVDQALSHFRMCLSNGRKIFLFGGLRGEMADSTQNFERAAISIEKAMPDEVVLIGEHPFDPLIRTLQQKAPSIKLSRALSYQEAVHALKTKVNHHDLILIQGDKKIPLEMIAESFHGSVFPNQYLINLAAIESNVSSIKKKLGPKTRLMPIIKANAYGSNDIRIAQFLTEIGIDIFAVTYVDEGIALKRAGIKADIFSWHAGPLEAEKVVEWDLQAGVGERENILALAQAAKQNKKGVKVHLHVDTGMNRLGCRIEEALALAKEIENTPYLKLEGVFTHFAASENPEEDFFTKGQINRFNEMLDELSKNGISPPYTHAANSAGAARFSLPMCNMVRIGLSLYGLSPSKAAKEALELRPALTLTSRIVGINKCKSGDSVSYGRNYRIEKENARIAVIPIGYFDGIHRSYSGKGFLMIRGKKAPIVGNICMDFMMADITHIPEAAINEPVLIFGEDEFGNSYPAEEIALLGNTIVYELIACLGPRIQRVFIHEETEKSC